MLASSRLTPAKCFKHHFTHHHHHDALIEYASDFTGDFFDCPCQLLQISENTGMKYLRGNSLFVIPSLPIHVFLGYYSGKPIDQVATWYADIPFENKHESSIQSYIIHRISYIELQNYYINTIQNCLPKSSGAIVEPILLCHKAGSRLKDERNGPQDRPNAQQSEPPGAALLEETDLVNLWHTKSETAMHCMHRAKTWNKKQKKQDSAGLKPPEIVGPTREHPKYLLPLFWIYLSFWFWSGTSCVGCGWDIACA